MFAQALDSMTSLAREAKLAMQLAGVACVAGTNDIVKISFPNDANSANNYSNTLRKLIPPRLMTQVAARSSAHCTGDRLGLLLMAEMGATRTWLETVS